jgi:hypothetical protein
MIVWRVENIHGKGPYNPGAGILNIQEVFFEEFDPKHHPVPSECPVISQRWIKGISGDVFGFISKDDYLTWFFKKKWRSWLSENGFYLCKFDADDLVIGKKQILFDRDSARLLNPYSPLHFEQ